MSSLLPKVDIARANPIEVADRNVRRFTVRALGENDGGAFKALRLEALRTDGNYFGTSYDEERELTSDQWRQRCKRDDGHCIFGLFDGSKLIGVMEATKCSEAEEGKTVLWGSAYLDRAYRGKGIAAPLYEARHAWSKQRFDFAIFFIREGNRRSTEIHRKQGAEHTHDEPKRWADGTVAIAQWYRTQLASPAPGTV